MRKECTLRAWKPLTIGQPLYQQKSYLNTITFDAEPNKSIKTNYHEGSCPNGSGFMKMFC